MHGRKTLVGVDLTTAVTRSAYSASPDIFRLALTQFPHYILVVARDVVRSLLRPTQFRASDINAVKQQHVVSYLVP